MKTIKKKRVIDVNSLTPLQIGEKIFAKNYNMTILYIVYVMYIIYSLESGQRVQFVC